MDVRRAGLFHTAYSGDLFSFFLWDATNATERAELRGMIGDDAEQLTFLFGTILRSKLLGLHELMQKDWNGISQPMPDAGTSGTFNAESRLVDEVAVTAKQVAKILVVTIADYMEQMVEVCGAATPA